MTSRQRSCLVWTGFLFFLSFSVFAPSAVAQDTPTAPPQVPQITPPTAAQGQQQQQQPNDDRRQPSGAVKNAEPVNSSTYKIGAADILGIHVWNEPQFSGPVTVHEDGMITLPLLGDLKAGDMTPVQVEQEVTKALTKYVRQPLVTITVQEVGSKKYYMDGQIARPGEYPLVVPTTILEAISKAGGLAGFANPRHVYVLRGTRQIHFNYKDVLKGKKMSQNIELKPGDHVVVP
ncbi:MAG TPA: polysaccharide biosynthesis/export family protein [Bryobacteraceae bacterium]|nr:polysaccharide biosynthesis/export family protein [Bryobacteraceae bacterium]